MANRVKIITTISTLGLASLAGVGTVMFILYSSKVNHYDPEAIRAWFKDFESIVRDIIFVVPLISAITVALFNNIFKLYDKVEQTRNAFLAKEIPIDETKFQNYLVTTDALSREIIKNVRYAILISVLIYLLLLIRRSVGSFGTVAIFSVPLEYLIAGLVSSLLVTIPAVLIDQISTLPGFVQMYRLLIEASAKTNKK